MFALYYTIPDFLQEPSDGIQFHELFVLIPNLGFCLPITLIDLRYYQAHDFIRMAILSDYVACKANRSVPTHIQLAWLTQKFVV